MLPCEQSGIRCVPDFLIGLSYLDIIIYTQYASEIVILKKKTIINKKKCNEHRLLIADSFISDMIHFFLIRLKNTTLPSSSYNKAEV